MLFLKVGLIDGFELGPNVVGKVDGLILGGTSLAAAIAVLPM